MFPIQNEYRSIIRTYYRLLVINGYRMELYKVPPLGDLYTTPRSSLYNIQSIYMVSKLPPMEPKSVMDVRSKKEQYVL